MNEAFGSYWPIILVALAAALVLAFLLLRPKQRVRLTDSAPVRPHMARTGGETVLGHEAEVSAKHVLGTQPAVEAGGGAPDDLLLLKGVGPKFAAMLNAHGITRFAQIAHLTESEIERLDADLGPFRGRIVRDRIVEQADYLARGDTDGFEQRFGKL